MIKKECIQCKKEFTLTDSEIEFYQSRKLSIPKRCKECRNLNKNKKQEESTLEVCNTKQYHNKRIGFNIILLLLFLCVVVSVSWGLFRYYNNQKQNPEQSIEYNSDNSQKQNPEQTVENNEDNSQKEISEQTIENIDDNSTKEESPEQSVDNNEEDSNQDSKQYTFRTEEYCIDHFEKHGKEFGYHSVEEYVEGANTVINSSEALHKLEKEDGDDIYYLKSTNEFVLLSTDGYIRTYFKPEDGIEYYNRQ